MESIPLNETKLIVNGVFFTLCFLGAVALLCFVIRSDLFQLRNPKEQNRLNNLRARAQEDPVASKQLEKLLRKQKKRHKKNLGEAILIYALLTLMISLTLLLAVIPCWTDYFRKDYLVYEGEFEVYYSSRRYRIRLENGSVLDGGGSLEEGSYQGRVVYARRTNLVLGTDCQ